MKLISCYIENFGTLSKYSYDFTEGLNVIEEQNGWGKTTFASFLKAMLFGLEYSRSKKLLDRVRYMPWQGGKFGGNLTFEIQGKKYRIERYFGRKESEDKFVLYDLGTNLECHDYTNKLGEEIWKVDRDSYEKSAFIILQDTSLLNDIISGRLGDIKEQEADMDQSSGAIALLEKEIKKLNPNRRAAGEINKRKEEDKELRGELKRCEASLQLFEKCEKWIEEEYKILEGIEREKQELEIKVALKSSREEYKDACEFFGDKVITQDDLEELSRRIREYDDLRVESHIQDPHMGEEVKKLKELEWKYRSIIIEEGEIGGCITSYSKSLGLEAQRRELEKKLHRVDNTIDRLEENGVAKARIGILGVLGILLAVIGIGVAIIYLAPGIALLLLGIALFGLQIMKNGNNYRMQRQELESNIRKRKSIELELQEVEEDEEKLKRGCYQFMRKMNIDDEDDIMNILLGVQKEYAEYERLQKDVERAKIQQEEKLQVVMQRMRKMKAIIDEVFSYYYEGVQIDYNASLDYMKAKHTLLKEQNKKYQMEKKRYEEFLKENGKRSLEQMESISFLEVETVAKMTEELTHKKNKANEKIAKYMYDRSLAQIEMDKIVDIEASIERNKLEIVRMQATYELLVATKECMEQAKENIVVKYMANMSAAFRKYMGILGTVDTSVYSIDTQLNVKVEESGSRHDSERLSRGKRDLVQFCMRMALVQAVYKDVENPLLILDDPFVNLDAPSIACGVELLRKIEKEYQMIYFVCHNSRM